MNIGFYRLKTQSGYTIREELHQGRKHLVLPVVMLVEGVHAGSHGPLLHLADEMGRFPGAWNGIPISVQHPQIEGANVSCNSPEVIDGEAVGRIYHTHMEDGKLKAEAWLDEGRLSQVSPEALAAIREGDPLDVSVGVFTDDEETPGEWNGEAYSAIARNHRPDHLALLPGGQGACSWQDGCGIRANNKGGETDKMKTLEKQRKDLASQGLAVNEMGFREISQTIQTKLDRMDDDTKLHYLEEVFPDYFVYRVSMRGGGDDAMFRRGYSTGTDGTVEFTGEALPVVKKVEYVNANTEIGANQKKGDESMKKPCCPEKVDALIASDKTKWTADDREMLLTMSEEQLEKLTPVEAKAPAAPQINKEQALEVLKEHLGDPDKALALFPKETREMLSDGLNLHRERKAALVEQIVANQATPVFTKESLEKKSMAELSELAQAIAPKTDFTPLGGGNGNSQPAAYKGDGLYPPGVE